MRRFYLVPTTYVLSKNIKIVKRFQLKFVIFHVSIFLFWAKVNSVDPDLAPHNVVYDEGLHCLYGGIFIISCHGRGSSAGSVAVYNYLLQADPRLTPCSEILS